jgi:hypothetical protein
LLVNGTKADVQNTDFIGNLVAIHTTGTGSDMGSFPPSGPTQVRIFGGSIVANGTAFFMHDPGTASSTSRSTILAFSTGSIVADFAGNATQTTGDGPSCVNACNTILAYDSATQNTGVVN